MLTALLENLEFLSHPQTRLLDDHPLPIWIIDAVSLKINYANRSAVTYYGYTVEEFNRQKFTDIFTVASRNRFFQHANSPGLKQLGGTYQHSKKDGELIMVELFEVSFNWENNTYYQITAVDVTAKDVMQQELEESRRRYKTFIEQSSEGIYCQEFRKPVWVKQPTEKILECLKEDGYISECNDAMARMYGFHFSDELLGAMPEKILDFSDQANIEFLRTFIDNGFTITNTESSEKDRYGNQHYFLNNAIGIIENEYLVRIWGTQREITQNKTLEERTKLLSNLVEQTTDILTASDLDFKPITWNKASESVYGLTSEQVIGKDIRNFISINYHGFNKEEVRAAINKAGEWRGEASFLRPTDNKLITLLITFKLRTQNNTPVGYLISGTDISDRKNSELVLRESENRFRELADSAPVMIWISDTEDKITYVNKPWANFTGLDQGKIKNIGWMNLLHTEDVLNARETFNKNFARRLPVTMIYRLKQKDGHYRWVQETGIPRKLSDGTFIGYIGSIIDIHDQKIREEQLSYQATILENVSDIVITTDLNFLLHTINKAGEECYGISQKKDAGKKITDIIPFQYLGTNAEQIMAEFYKNGFWKGETSVAGKNDEVKYFVNHLKYVFDSNGSKLGVLLVCRDITERKLAEKKLAKSEKFYRTLIADSLNGTLLLDEAGRLTFGSPSVSNILGFEPDEIIGRNAFEFVHPDDLSWAFESFQKEVIEKPEIKFIVVRLLRKDGSWLWCMVRGHNMLKNSDVNSIVVYFHDDSLRKQANDALKESEKRFRNLIRELQIGIVVQDKEGKTIMCNEAFSKLLLTPEDVLIGKTIYEIVPDAIQENGKVYRMEERPSFKSIHTRMPAKDVVLGLIQPQTKDRIWVIINSDPVLNEKGEIVHIISSVKDITERKRLEEVLMKEQINHQKQLTQATIDGQEKERSDIGKELHDNIGQHLTTIKLFLDMAKGTADDNTLEMISMALKGTSDLINEVRSMSRSLIPSTLKDLGLIESIKELFRNRSETRLMKTKLIHEGFSEDFIPQNQKLALFRIIQEQLNNVVTHSAAKMVTVQLDIKANGIYLEMKDDGKGFNVTKKNEGLGLINIKNRAELFGGKIEILSQPRKGCLLKVFLPLEVSQIAGNQL